MAPSSSSHSSSKHMQDRVCPQLPRPNNTSSSATAAAASSTPAPTASPSLATSRLSLLSNHFRHRPLDNLELNTPYSTERNFVTSTKPPPTSSHPALRRMATKTPSQPAHPSVLIPGPIEYSDDVLNSMSHYSESHVGAPFVATFSSALTQLRQLFQTTSPSSQPFVISGSGTLGWDQVAANLAEPGDEVLVLHTGYFADSFADCFAIYGSKPTQLKAPIGERPSLQQVEEELKKKTYKILTVTHVDTSTGVLYPEIKELIALVRKVSPSTLVVVDGVCSVGAEDLQFDAWDVDVAITASQKAIGCPAGLSIIMASGRAMQVFESRKVPPNSYFASWKNWTPIMRNYEAKKPSYFATPSPQLIHALDTALKQILAKPLSERFERHKAVSQKVKQRVESLGLKQLPKAKEDQASTMTAIWLPEGVLAAEFLPGLLNRGIVFAGGLHKEVATKYIRFGHMSVSVMDHERMDIDKALDALGERLSEVKKEKGM
ncbi:MAG: hypothetical protein M1828_002841 [Chrysothrix sp. TS-e1954]|nr:MAG: hypothetical protein M1828_002841 [Chrysothrix sp. TS-e1954]